MKTTSFTPEQQVEVDRVLDQLTRTVATTLNAESPRIQEMDKRPREVWSEAKPDVYFRYGNQAMLEDLIAKLQEMV